ncbi:MAG: hypothetical protein AB7F67_11025 [Rhodospirillaceae bacterium]
MTAAAARPHDGRIVLAAAVAMVAVAAWPVLATEFLPLLDYPNHLARMHVLLAYDDTPALHEFYEITWGALPNLAMEMVVLPLAHLMPLAAAGKTFVVLCLAVQVAGVLAIHRALHGYWSPWPLAVVPILYNDTFLFGFVNYLFGFGLALLAFAGWIALAGRGLALRLAAGTLAGTLVWFCHLTAFGVYAILVCAYEASRSIARWRAGGPLVGAGWLAALGQFAVPAILMFGFATTGEGGTTDWSFVTDKWHYFQKIDLVADVFRTYDGWTDKATMILYAGAVGLGFALRRLAFARHGFLTVLGVGAAFALAPKKVLTGAFLDDRLAMTAVFVAVAAIDWRGVGRRWQYAAASVLAVVLVVRVVAVEATWRTWDRQFAAYVRAIDALPEGARLTAALGYCCDTWARRRPPLVHLPNYVITDRNGFFPLFFAIPGQQPVTVRPPYAARAKEVENEISLRGMDHALGPNKGARNPFLPEYLDGFDYVLAIRLDQFGAPPPPDLEAVVTGDNFGLYRIAPKN